MEILRTEVIVTKYVIIAQRDGRLKYVSRQYNPRKDYGYSVKINNAMLFEKPEDARKAMENFRLNGHIGKIERRTELVEVMG